MRVSEGVARMIQVANSMILNSQLIINLLEGK